MKTRIHAAHSFLVSLPSFSSSFRRCKTTWLFSFRTGCFRKGFFLAVVVFIVLTKHPVSPGLIILNAWYGKFVTDNSRKHERARVIDVTVPLQCLVKDSKLILTEASKVNAGYMWMRISQLVCVSISLVLCTYLVTCTVSDCACVQAGLPGFYDPCVGEDKSLKVLYQFRGVMHQVLSADTEALRIPKQCKIPIMQSFRLLCMFRSL